MKVNKLKCFLVVSFCVVMPLRLEVQCAEGEVDEKVKLEKQIALHPINQLKVETVNDKNIEELINQCAGSDDLIDLVKHIGIEKIDLALTVAKYIPDHIEYLDNVSDLVKTLKGIDKVKFEEVIKDIYRQANTES